MITLVLNLRRSVLEYTWFIGGAETPVHHGETERASVPGAVEGLERVLADSRAVASVGQYVPNVVVFRIPYGGDVFAGPTRMDAAAITRLESLVEHAPLHLPGIVALIRACSTVFKGVPVVGTFETTFFRDLPAHEHLYAVDAKVSRSLHLRRYGYYGHLHQHACRFAEAELALKKARLLSICLEPRPELAAVVGDKPVMVTGGATPLEGLPGEHTSGDIDPSIILTLVQDKWGGLEKINMALTQQSGLLGLAGCTVKLSDLYDSDSPQAQLGRKVFDYRLLLAGGAAIAAMDGLDGIVFSGRYHASGQVLGPWVTSTLGKAIRGQSSRLRWCIFNRSCHSIIARLAEELVSP